MSAIRNRWRRLKGLLAFGWFLGFYYGDSVRKYPPSVAIKMLAARLAFLVPLPLLLPDRRFLLRRHGARMYRQVNTCPIDLDVAFETYEYWKTRLFSSLVKEGMTVLDIGACEGYYSLLFAKLMGDKGRVLAFEPDPSNSLWLKKNIAANGFKSIEVHEYALSDREGQTTFYPGGGVGSLINAASSLAAFHDQSEPITVRTRRLDDVLRDAGITRVDLMKIDVEGADLLVLRGAEQALRTMDVRILMDVDVTGDERIRLFDLLHSCGFSLYRIGKELQPITWPPDPSSLPQPNAAGEGTLTRRLAKLLPPRIRSVLALPARWFITPRGIREIYAVKSGDARQP